MNNYKKYDKKTVQRTTVFKYIIAILCVVIFAYISAVIVLKHYIYPLKYFDIVKEQSSKNGIDAYLVMAVIKTESAFNPYVMSYKEAKGLMQIMDSTANDFNKENSNINLFDEDTNITYGCKYLSHLISKYDGNYYLAICAYNAGMGNVDRWITNGVISKNLNQFKDTNIPFLETKNYLYKVISAYEMYKKLYK